MKFLKSIYMYFFHKEQRKEVHVQNKDDKDIYYMIRFNEKEGLLSMFFKAMAFIEFAEKNNFIPFIDMKNYPTMYSIDKIGGRMENAWELFFSQPNRIDIDVNEIYKKKIIFYQDIKIIIVYLMIHCLVSILHLI